MRKTLLISFIAFGVAACGSSSVSLDDYFEAVDSSGSRITNYRQKFFTMVGAIDGLGFNLDGERCEAYEFDLDTRSGKNALERAKTDGLMGRPVAVHKNLMVLCYGDGKGAKTAYEVLKSL